MPAIITRPVSGSMVWLYVNGEPWGNVMTFRVRMSSNNRRRGELDSNTAVELVPTAYTVQGSMDIYRLINDGGAEGRDIMASQQYSARQRYVSIKLENRLTKEIIFESNYARFTDQSWDYKAKTLVTGTLMFECLNWSSDGTQNQFSDTKPSDEKVSEIAGPNNANS